MMETNKLTAPLGMSFQFLKVLEFFDLIISDMLRILPFTQSNDQQPGSKKKHSECAHCR